MTILKKAQSELRRARTASAEICKKKSRIIKQKSRRKTCWKKFSVTTNQNLSFSSQQITGRSFFCPYNIDVRWNYKCLHPVGCLYQSWNYLRKTTSKITSRPTSVFNTLNECAISILHWKNKEAERKLLSVFITVSVNDREFR